MGKCRKIHFICRMCKINFEVYRVYGINPGKSSSTQCKKNSQPFSLSFAVSQVEREHCSEKAKKWIVTIFSFRRAALALSNYTNAKCDCCNHTNIFPNMMQCDGATYSIFY